LKVKRLFLGNSFAYLLIFNGTAVLIDTGLGCRVEKFQMALEEEGLSLESLELIIVTHAHYDHVGGLKELKRLTGAQIVSHIMESDKLELGKSPVPHGTMAFSKPISWLGCAIFKSCIRFPGVKVDFTFDNEMEIPVENKILRLLHTPGHTSGSISVVVDNYAFVGDTLFHLLPNRIFPPFADNLNELALSWKALLNSGAKIFYPGHGKPISCKLLRDCLKKDFVGL
jgi:glyoxylase-like metal-dependent hydrolase (beta-lactamase superfamily II)